jgi:hypothetical protein
MTHEIPFDVLAEDVRSEVVKASSDAALLEKLIFPLIKQERLWQHYPALLHGLWVKDRAIAVVRSIYDLMPRSLAAVPPRMATRSASESPGVFSTRSTEVDVHG